MPLVETGKGLQGGVQYSTDLFEAGTIERMIGHFRQLLSGIVAAPERPIGAYELLSEEERGQVLKAVERREVRGCVHELFRAQAEKNAEAAAVVWRGRELRYGELESQSNRLARYLRGQGVKVEERIGIAMERSPEMIVAQLGILKAGGTYVPLDLGHPESRLQYMIENAEIGRVVSQGTAREQLRRHGREILCLDEEWGKIAAYEDSPLPPVTTPENLAYVIYTSGSSGQPKASMITHQAVASMAMDSDYMRLQAADRMAQVTNSSFDISMYEIYGALLNGARLVIFDRETVLDPGELAQGLVGEGITSIFMATAIFNQLAATAPECFSGLRYVMFGGEAADVHAVQRAAACSPRQHGQSLRSYRSHVLLHLFPHL